MKILKGMVENKFPESDSLREGHLNPISLGTSCASPFAMLSCIAAKPGFAYPGKPARRVRFAPEAPRRANPPAKLLSAAGRCKAKSKKN